MYKQYSVAIPKLLFFALPSMLTFLALVLSFQSCAGGGSGGSGTGIVGAATSTQEVWKIDLVGTGSPLQCPVGETGEFSEGFYSYLVFEESLVDTISRDPSTNPGSQTRWGNGVYNGTENVSQQSSSPTICILDATTVTNELVTAEAIHSSSSMSVFLRSTGVLLPNRTHNSSNVRNDVPSGKILLTATSVASTAVTGTWQTIGDGAGSGNTGHGTFVMQYWMKGKLLPPNSGFVLTPGSQKINIRWSPIDNASRHRIYYAEGDTVTTESPMVETGPGGAAGTDITGLDPTKSYSFLVISVIDIVDITTKPHPPEHATPLN